MHALHFTSYYDNHFQTCFCFVYARMQNVLRHSTVSTIRIEVKHIDVLFDKQKNHQAVNRLVHIFVFHSVDDTVRTSCVRLFETVLLTETYDNITAVKISSREFTWFDGIAIDKDIVTAYTYIDRIVD